MKNRTLIKLAFVGALAFGAASCELVELDTPGANTSVVQDDPIQEEHVIPSTVPTTESDLLAYLTNGSFKSWNAASFTLQGIDGFQQCRLDDTFVFNIDGSYIYDSGETLCGAEDNEEVRTGNWIISFDDLEITIDPGTSNEFTAEIIGSTDDRIALSSAYMGLEVIGVYQSN